MEQPVDQLGIDNVADHGRARRFSKWVTDDDSRLGAVALLAVLLFASVLAAWSVGYRRRFSYDSMVYVDTARHIAAGQGIVHSVAGAHSTRMPLRAALPEPLVSQPPGYPLLIAATTFLGLSEENGALLWPTLGYAAILLLCWRLVSASCGSAAGALATLLLLLLAPLRDAAASAWSETVAIAFWAAAVVVLVPGVAPNRRPSAGRAFCGGVLVGLAFATRYAFWPAMPVVVVALAPWKSGRRCVLWWSIAAGSGALLPVFLVLGRNAALGMPMGEPRAAATASPTTNLGLALWSLFGQWAGRNHVVWQVAAAIVVLVALVATAVDRREVGLARMTQTPRFLASWVATYGLALVVEASVLYFDPLSPRLLLPAAVALMCWVGAILGSRLNRPLCVHVALALAAFAFSGWHILMLARARPRTETQVVDSSERLRWLREHTRPRDLIIGQTTAEIGFYLRRCSVSILAAPMYRPVTFEEVMTVATSACRNYPTIYLALRNPDRGIDIDATWGPFVGDLLRGESYPDWKLEGTFADGSVMRFVGRCAGS